MRTRCCAGLLGCEEQPGLGGTVLALDGLKRSSHASKEWRGTLEELRHKQAKVAAKIAQGLAAHPQVDAQGQSDEEPEVGLPAVAGSDRERSHAEWVGGDDHAGGCPEDETVAETCQPEASSEREPVEAASPTAEGALPDRAPEAVKLRAVGRSEAVREGGEALPAAAATAATGTPTETAPTSG